MDRGKCEEGTTVESSSSGREGLGGVVASHYNGIKEKGLGERYESKIFYMRNFNNWIKSMLLQDYTDLLRDNSRHGSLRALDLGCGKGGDLNKWLKCEVSHLVCADIAEVSVTQAKRRYEFLCRRNKRFGRIFDAEFITADCTKERLLDKLEDPEKKFDIVSCQFAFHYCFESLSQAECMLSNVSKSLRKGGYFIGTTPNAYDIVNRVKSSTDRKRVGNSIYSIEFECPLSDETQPPLFGAKYNFRLDGVVDCPEFLVHFPTLVKLAREKFGLSLTFNHNFSEYYQLRKQKGSNLLQQMKALETYQPFPPSQKTNEGQYDAADKFFEASQSESKVGTLSKDEWEAASVYLVFAFQKVE